MDITEQILQNLMPSENNNNEVEKHEPLVKKFKITDGQVKLENVSSPATVQSPVESNVLPDTLSNLLPTLNSLEMSLNNINNNNGNVVSNHTSKLQLSNSSPDNDKENREIPNPQILNSFQNVMQKYNPEAIGPMLKEDNYYNKEGTLVIRLCLDKTKLDPNDPATFEKTNIKSNKDYMRYLREAVAAKITPAIVQEGYKEFKDTHPDSEPFVMRLNMRAETKRGVERANMCYRCWSDKKEFKIFFKSQDGGSAVTSHMRKHEPGYRSESYKRKMQNGGGRLSSSSLNLNGIGGQNKSKEMKFEMDFQNWRGAFNKSYVKSADLSSMSPLAKKQISTSMGGQLTQLAQKNLQYENYLAGIYNSDRLGPVNPLLPTNAGLAGVNVSSAGGLSQLALKQSQYQQNVSNIFLG